MCALPDLRLCTAVCAVLTAAGQVEAEAPRCGIIPALSQLKDGKRYNSCFIERYLKNVQCCLDRRKGNAG